MMSAFSRNKHDGGGDQDRGRGDGEMKIPKADKAVIAKDKTLARTFPA
jgi:hypothetical protein